MKQVGDPAVPVVGSQSHELGVRVPPSSPSDIAPDVAGYVAPGTGGMSAAATVEQLPPFLIPRRLRHRIPDATAKDDRAVFRFGEGDFVSGPFSVGLSRRVDHHPHGLIEPGQAMSVAALQAALAATQAGWTLAEEDP